MLRDGAPSWKFPDVIMLFCSRLWLQNSPNRLARIAQKSYRRLVYWLHPTALRWMLYSTAPPNGVEKKHRLAGSTRNQSNTRCSTLNAAGGSLPVLYKSLSEVNAVKLYHRYCTLVSSAMTLDNLVYWLQWSVPLEWTPSVWIFSKLFNCSRLVTDLTIRSTPMERPFNRRTHRRCSVTAEAG